MSHVDTYNFSDILDYIKHGFRAARLGWNGKSQWIEAQFPDAHSKMSLPYIYINTVDNNRCPWLASQTDIFANDWILIDHLPTEQCKLDI